jgi:hypothetical protein
MSNRFSALSSCAGAIVTPRRGRLMPDRHCPLASDEESWDHSSSGRCKNPAPRVTFDDHDHLNIRDRSGGRQASPAAAVPSASVEGLSREGDESVE